MFELKLADNVLLVLQSPSTKHMGTFLNCLNNLKTKLSAHEFQKLQNGSQQEYSNSSFLTLNSATQAIRCVIQQPSTIQR
jgi:hypothetical protein